MTPARDRRAELAAREVELAARWRLALGEELGGRRLSSVRLVRRDDGSEAVLELCGPCARPADEIACLQAWDGGPAPRLLDADAAAGALLLERIVPGTRADALDAEGAVALLRSLHVEPPPGIPPLVATVRRRVERAAEDGRATPQRVDWALAALERLAAEEVQPVLVHGAFDHRNVLACRRRGVCAIDPSPAAGDGAYDAATWVHANRRPGRRARFEAMLGAGGYDRARLRDWCGVVAVHG